MTELLERAFRALGPGADFPDVRVVVKTLRQADDEETTALLDAAADNNGDAWDEVVAIAHRAEAHGFVAMLVVGVWRNPALAARKSGPLGSP